LGKGAKDRVVPIGQRACEWIEKYVHEIRPNLVNDMHDTTLFVNRQGNAFHPDGLTKMVRNYMKKAGIVGQASCHLLRHSMATSMLENGADIRYIQALLGHASLDNTQIYTKVAIMKLKEVHALTHPARLKKDAP
jgi:integrase/recombinase XerD